MQQHGHVQMLHDLLLDWVRLPCNNMVTCKCCMTSDLIGWGCHVTTWSRANASWTLTWLGEVAMQQHGHVQMLHELWPDWVRLTCNNMVTCKCFMNSDLIGWGCHVSTWSRANASWTPEWSFAAFRRWARVTLQRAALSTMTDDSLELWCNRWRVCRVGLRGSSWETGCTVTIKANSKIISWVLRKRWKLVVQKTGHRMTAKRWIHYCSALFRVNVIEKMHGLLNKQMWKIPNQCYT